MAIRRISYSVVRVWMVVLALCASPGVNAHLPLALNDNERPTLSPLLEDVTPAVVNISVTGTTETRQNSPFQDPNLRRYFRFPEQGPAVPRQGEQALASSSTPRKVTCSTIIM